MGATKKTAKDDKVKLKKKKSKKLNMVQKAPGKVGDTAQDNLRKALKPIAKFKKGDLKKTRAKFKKDTKKDAKRVQEDNKKQGKEAPSEEAHLRKVMRPSKAHKAHKH